jgi:hypothetical protein
LLTESVSRDVIADALRAEVNVSKALLSAEAALAEDGQEPPDERVDADWLYRWRESAGAVSRDELQNVWGRVLAGEIKSPGSYSLRTLEFLRSVSKEEADDIERISRLVVADLIIRDDTALKEANVDLTFLLKMQDLGIISGVESLGLSRQFRTVKEDSFLRLFVSKERGLLVSHTDKSKVLELPMYKVSAIGVQVLTLGVHGPNVETLRHFGRIACAQGFSASLVDVAPIGGGRTRYWNPNPICPEASAAAAPQVTSGE